MIRAVIFDFNGVLVDDEPVHFEMFREVLAEEGIALTSEAYHEEYLGLDDWGCFEAVLSDSGQAFDRKRLDELVARKARRYIEVAKQGLRIFPGAPESVATLSERWPLAICSGALRPEIEFVLGMMGVRDRISAIVAAEDTTRCKPDPEGYIKAHDALTRTREGRPDLEAGQCLVFEDSLAGIASARSAGMRAVGVSHTYSRDDLFSAGAEFVLEHLPELNPAWIDRRFGGPA